MNRFLLYAVLATGLGAVCWVGAGYVGSNPLALAITGAIGAFYLVGAIELLRFRQATSTLTRAVSDLAEAPASLRPWIDALHPSLRNATRLRIEGERVGLPGPALTPYLAGLLVLLGMLGTFVGMVATLKGTGLALESATDMDAIRSSLSAPVKGLGLAFGTSVAGVAASAMLGLASALCRRERLQAGQMLDTTIATSLRVFSLVHQREESFKVLQGQAQLMPQLVDELRTMVAAMERRSEMLGERLAAGQDQFHDKAEAAYGNLAASVDRTLKESLTESARIAGATIQPAVEATMAGIARETTALHDTVARTVQLQVDGLSSRFGETLDHAHAHLQIEIAARDEKRLAAWTQSLSSMAATLQEEWQRTGAQTASLQQQLFDTLAQTARDMSAQTEAHAKATVAEVAHLLQAASEAPRVAAEVVAELRQKLSESIARDNAMLEERSRILETLGTLLDAVNHASTDQRAAVDALVDASTGLLDRVGNRFTESVDAETEKLGAVSAQIVGSAAEVASLGEAFGFAVQLFSESNDKMAAQLQRIEGALGKSIARSDEQLAYYVAQAREVIDLSLMSQKQIVEDLQQIAGRQALAGSEA